METGQFVPNFTDSVLIHRKLIEDLNAEIKVRKMAGWEEKRGERGGRREGKKGGQGREGGVKCVWHDITKCNILVPSRRDVRMYPIVSLHVSLHLWPWWPAASCRTLARAS